MRRRGIRVAEAPTRTTSTKKKTETIPAQRTHQKLKRQIAGREHPVKKNRHPGKLTLNVLNTSLTTLHESQALTDPGLQSSTHDPQLVLEEIACAIAEAQAALFSGRVHDLERSTIRQQDLCALLKDLEGKSSAAVPPGDDDRRALAQTARQVRQQNLIFGAVLRRMRCHLDTLRNLLRGLSLTYEPTRLRAPGREG
jgi:hypothetical protein